MNNRKRKKLRAFPCMGCGKIHGERRIDRRRRQSAKSIKRRRHRRDMRQDALYRYVWISLEDGFTKAMNFAILGVEDPKDFKGLREFDGGIESFLGFMEDIDFEYVADDD